MGLLKELLTLPFQGLALPYYMYVDTTLWEKAQEADEAFAEQERTCLYRAEAWLNREEPAKAIPEYRQGFAALVEHWNHIRSPRKWHYLAHLALAMIRTEEFDEAISLMTTLLQEYPDFSTAFNFRGWAYFDKGMRAEAIANFQEAIRCDPNNENAREGLRMAQQ